MSQKFNSNADYFLVEGWFDQSKGLNDNKFYGACCDQHDPMTPKMVVLEGSDAKLAANNALSNMKLQLKSVLQLQEGKKVDESDKMECKTCGEVFELEGAAANPKCPSCGEKYLTPASEEVKKKMDDEEEVITEVEPCDEANAAPSKGAKNAGKGKDKIGAGDLQSEGVETAVNEDSQLDAAVNDIESTKDEAPKDKNIENLKDFYNNITSAVKNIDDALKSAMTFGLDGTLNDQLAKAHNFLYKIGTEFLKIKGQELQSAGADDQLAEAVKKCGETIEEMTTGTGAVAMPPAGGYETLKGAKKAKKTKKTKDKPKDEYVMKTGQDLGTPDRGQGQGNNNIEGFNPRKIRHLDEVKSKKTPAVPHKKFKTMKSTGTTKSGRYATYKESIETGDRVVIIDVHDENYKSMNGARGAVVSINEGINPYCVQLDNEAYGMHHANFDETEIKLINEDETMELAKWIANTHKITDDKTIGALHKEILEWASNNNMNNLMQRKHDIKPIFSMVLESIVNG